MQRRRLLSSLPPRFGALKAHATRLALLLALPALLTACQNEFFSTGSIELTLSGIPADAVVLSLEGIASGATLRESRVQEDIDVTSRSTVTLRFEGVATGEWFFVVDAEAADGTVIGGAHATVTVHADAWSRLDVSEWDARLRTPHGEFIGYGTDAPTLQAYADAFEDRFVAALEDSTGLKPRDRVPVFHIVGDESTWNRVSPCAYAWGCYTSASNAIYMAHWRSSSQVNTVLLPHEYFHWLAWEVGKVGLPYWFNEGFAYAESWRLQLGADSWDNDWSDDVWEALAATTGPVPPLAEAGQHEDGFLHAVAATVHALETRGGKAALRAFFQHTEAGSGFQDAFQQAFSVSVAAYEVAYQGEVARRRSAHAVQVLEGPQVHVTTIFARDLLEPWHEPARSDEEHR